MKLGDRLTELRKEKNKTQKEIASLLNISQSAYSHWEKNFRQPKFSYLEKLAVIYEIQVSQLFANTELTTDIKNNLFDTIILELYKEGYIDSSVSIDNLPEHIQKIILSAADAHIASLLEKSKKNQTD